MSFDGMFTYGMTHELNEKIMGGRITKVHQPYKHDVIFHIRAKEKTKNYYYRHIRAIHGCISRHKPMKIQVNRQCFACC